MLQRLLIRDIILVEKLDLEFSTGLSVLTGETGAGKSILFDALGLALGGRSESGLVRVGQEKGSVTAVFELSPGHAAVQILEQKGLSNNDDLLILRRQITVDGRSRAFVNDEPVSISFLRLVGAAVTEIHGQHDDQGLMNPKGHQTLLDAFANHEKLTTHVRRMHQDWRAAQDQLQQHEKSMEQSLEEQDYDRHCLEELIELDPQDREEEMLADERALMMQSERIGTDISEIASSLQKDGGVDATLRGAMRCLERIKGPVETRLAPVIEALHQANTGAEEAINHLAGLTSEIAQSPERIDAIEERLFAIRAIARKHRCQPGDLPKVKAELETRLGEGEDNQALRDKLQSAVGEARTLFEKAVKKLSDSRRKAAKKLERTVNSELPALKLKKARFRVALKGLPLEDWNGDGAEKLSFEVKTNPGVPFGSLIKIASGGELSRFILALKVALAGAGSPDTLVFDEIDRGLGGAVADAVGLRLAVLARTAQVMVVTHSPQVAARGNHHWYIQKTEEKVNGGHQARIQVTRLDAPLRREEIARMLSGAKITDEARAAALTLLKPVE